MTPSWIWPWLVETTRGWWFLVQHVGVPAAILLCVVLWFQNWLETS